MAYPLRPRDRACAAIGFILVLLGGTGCALRATTDFGPQSPTANQSISAGPQGFPGGISADSTPNGGSVGARHGEGANTFDGAGVSAASH